MKLIAKKPCSFGGKRFYIGDEIPSELVMNPQDQEKMGRLAIVADEAAVVHPEGDKEPETLDVMTVLIHCEEGDMPLNLTQNGLQAVVDVLTSNAEDGTSIVKGMTDGDALILLDITDNRKTIKEAAKARAQVLNAEESEGEQ